MNELMIDWVRELSKALERAIAAEFMGEFNQTFFGRQVGRGYRGICLPEFEPPAWITLTSEFFQPKYDFGVLAPKCAHWHDWRFPTVHVGAWF